MNVSFADLPIFLLEDIASYTPKDAFSLAHVSQLSRQATEQNMKIWATSFSQDTKIQSLLPLWGSTFPTEDPTTADLLRVSTRIVDIIETSREFLPPEEERLRTLATATIRSSCSLFAAFLQAVLDQSTDEFFSLRLEKLPVSITDLPSSQARAAAIREWIKKHPLEIAEIKELYIEEQESEKIRVIPPEVSHFHNVSQLLIYAPSVEALPQEISSLKKLSYVAFAAKKIRSFPLLSGPKRIYLKDEESSKIVPTLWACKGVKALILEYPKVSTHPESAKDFISQLEEFELNG